MSSEEELRHLRQDLDSLIERASLISRRLESLETRAAKSPPLPERQRSAGLKRIESIEPEKPETVPLAPLSPTLPRPIPPSEPFAIPTHIITDPLVRLIRPRIDDFRARTRDLGWEVLLGTYMLPRIAVICIAIAVVFFLTLAIERWGAAFMPQFRVAIGYAVSAGLMLMAWRSEAKYPALARVLYGGGFAVMYFVTFATYYVEFAKIFETPAPALILMALLVTAWAIAAQVRKSKVIAALVTVLGHLTIFLATLTLEKPGSVSMTGIVALSAGSAFFLLRNHWYYIASMGLAGTYLNVFAVLAQGKGENPYLDFTLSMGLILLFFLIYALAEFFSPDSLRRKAVPGWFRNGFVTFNTAACFFLCTVVMSNYDFSREYQDLFRFAFGVLLLLLALVYLRLRSHDPLFNVYMVKSIAILTLALATRYGDNGLTIPLAIEMIVLLYTARRSGLIVLRILSLAVAAIAFLHAWEVATYANIGIYYGEYSLGLNPSTLPYAAPGYSDAVFSALFVVASFLIASQLYERTNWAALSPPTASLPTVLLGVLWQVDLIAEKPDRYSAVEKRFGGLLFPYLYALSGTALFLAFSSPMLHETHRFTVVALFVLLLTLLAAFFEAKPWGLAAMLVFLLGLLPLGAHLFLHQTSIHYIVAMAGLLAACATAFASEESYAGKRNGLAFHQHAVSPYLLYIGSVVLIALMLVKAFAGLNSVFALAVTAVFCAGFFLFLHPGAFTLLSGLMVFWASILFAIHLEDLPGAVPHRFRVAATILVALSILGARYFNALGRKRTPIADYLCAGLLINAFLVLLLYFEFRVTDPWRMTITALACFAFLGYARLFRTPIALLLSFAGMLYVSCRHSIEAFQADALSPGLVLAFLLASVYWILLERLYTTGDLSRYDKAVAKATPFLGFDPRHPAMPLFPIVLAALLLAILALRFPYLAPANLVLITIGWFALAALLFILSIPFRQRFYRYTGLALIFITLARLFLIDMKEQDPLLRVAAFAVAGAGLLAISIGYFKWMARLHHEPVPPEANKDGHPAA